MELASTWLARVFLRRDVNAPPEPSCTTRVVEGGADDVFRALEPLSSRECILVHGFTEIVRHDEACVEACREESRAAFGADGLGVPD